MLAVALIDGYQKFISPRKGFYCPHRLLHGRDSCSQHGKRIIRRFGLRRGLLLLERRLLDCRAAGMVLEQTGVPLPPAGPPAVKGTGTCGQALQSIDCGFTGLECIGDIASCF